MTHVRPLPVILVAALAAGCAANGEEETSAPPMESSAPAPDVTLSAYSPGAAPGDPVTLRATGFEPSAPVQFGFGPPESEYAVIETSDADASGTAELTLAVPASASPGRAYVFVATGSGSSAKAISDPFYVTADDGILEIEGRVTDEGVECVALRTDSGDLFTLAGADTDGLAPGDRVTVQGSIAEMSFCQQGITLAVTSVERHGDDPGM